MKILYVTTPDTGAQGDYQEVSMLHGLREVLGDDCIDFPRKKLCMEIFQCLLKMSYTDGALVC